MMNSELTVLFKIKISDIKNSDINLLPEETIIRFINEGKLCYKKFKKHIKNKTPNMYMTYFKRRDVGLKHIPTNMINLEMCKLEVERCDKLNLNQFRCFPDKFRPEFLYIDLNFFKDIQTNKTREMCEECINHSYKLIKYVPDEYKTQEMCERCVNKFKRKIQYVPDKYKTQEMCEGSVNKFKRLIKYVPDEFKTQKMCINCVSEDVGSIKYVPDEFITQEMCNNCAKHIYWSTSYLFKYIPRRFITQEICTRLSDCPNLIEYFPDEFKTQEICEKSVNHSRAYIKYVPDKFKTLKMCEKCVDQNYSLIQYVPDELKTLKMCALYLKKTGLLDHIPTRLYPNLMKEKKLFIKDIPKPDRTPELYDGFVRSNGLNLKKVPARIISLEICISAMRDNPLAFKYVPDEFKTQELVCESIKYYKYDRIVHLYKLIPQDMKTRELQVGMMKVNKFASPFFINNKIIHPDQYISVIEEYNKFIKYIPKESITSEMCIYAVEQNSKVIKYVPSEFLSTYMFSLCDDKYVPDEIQKLLCEREKIYMELARCQIIAKRYKVPFLLESDDIIKRIAHFIT